MGGGATWPVFAKEGISIPVTEKSEVSLDGRFHYSLTTPRAVENIWSLSVSAGFSCFFR
ncbi:MAG: hypothetical protein GKS04_05380 [Candidatus Mycalebacterium zealandia]|nr:MAG: hypothetical protein GKS04_05380 [Candidatus Mycalebacterium zealandia]